MGEEEQKGVGGEGTKAKETPGSEYRTWANLYPDECG